MLNSLRKYTCLDHFLQSKVKVNKKWKYQVVVVVDTVDEESFTKKEESIQVSLSCFVPVILSLIVTAVVWWKKRVWQHELVLSMDTAMAGVATKHLKINSSFHSRLAFKVSWFREATYYVVVSISAGQKNKKIKYWFISTLFTISNIWIKHFLHMFSVFWGSYVVVRLWHKGNWPLV